ncbi:MAG TPA: SH3 domain-containing protein [Candidatus Dormibacteraeota bacterium]
MNVRAAVLAAVLAAALAGCGSSSTPAPSGTSRPSAPATASPSPSPGAVDIGSTITVIAPLGLKLRDAGSPDGAVLGSLGQGTVVTVVSHGGQNNTWYQVKGETQTGWITDNPQFTSPRHFELYQSDARGFTALYLNTWSFTEAAGPVIFRPQSGGYPQIAVATGANQAALGAPGIEGYSTVQVGAAEVFGITGVLKLYARSGAAPPPTPGQPPMPPLLAELRVTLDANRAMRLDFLYPTADDLRTFRDFYGSIIVPQPASPGAVPATPKPA